MTKKEKAGDTALRENRIRRLIESTKAIPWEADAKTWQFTYVGQQAVDALGYPVSEWLQRDFWPNHIHPDDRDFAIGYCEKCSHECDEYDFEYRMIAADGSIVWLHDLVNVEYDKDGNPAFLRGFMIDITERRAAQEELKEAHDELEQAFSEIKGLQKKLEAENIMLIQEVKDHARSETMVGHSKVMNNMLAQARQVANTDTTLLITGETGTGKCVLARWVHAISGRGDRPLVQVNCSALPPNLVEAELFGREKGAYTGAITPQLGRFQVADGATLFLDEIGELPLETQVKLLHVLDEGRIERLGSPKPIEVDVRIIAATNRDLEQAIQEGTFRSDLYYRLNVFPIHVPPLRHRVDDIPALVWSFVEAFNRKLNKSIDRIPESDMQKLQKHFWSGNVRELRNAVERSMIGASGNTLRLSVPVAPHDKKRSMDFVKLEEIERSHIEQVLERVAWRVRGNAGAAQLLGLKPTTLESRMKKLGIRRPH